MISNLKIIFRTKHGGAHFFKMNYQSVGGNPIYGLPRGIKYQNFYLKIPPNIDIMKITVQFGPFDNAN